MEHSFTKKIKEILEDNFKEKADEIYNLSFILQYINNKTRSANRSSKSRGSFANLYAIYVLVEDYISKNFDKNGNYSTYSGALYTNLLNRQREMPFGAKLQNHGLNGRMNDEFKKFFPLCEFIPILRDSSKKYWVNENLLNIKLTNETFNIAKVIIEIIDEYKKVKTDLLDQFIQSCEELKNISDNETNKTDSNSIENFISSLLAQNTDARLFEIASYSILKYFYHEQKIYFGFDIDKLEQENLKLYKTGRTNANDGGIDFVMKPLGRFFQVTETLDVKKYFLDIDKVERYPVTFVIKSDDSVELLKARLKAGAEKQYSILKIVENYMACIEEIINIPILKQRFKDSIDQGYLADILNEIIKQSKVEFNYQDELENDEIDLLESL